MRSPSAASGGFAPSGNELRNRLAPLRQRLLAPSDHVEPLVGRGDADHPGEGVLRHGDVGQLGRPGEAAGNLPLDQVRVP